MDPSLVGKKAGKVPKAGPRDFYALVSSTVMLELIGA